MKIISIKSSAIVWAIVQARTNNNQIKTDPKIDLNKANTTKPLTTVQLGIFLLHVRKTKRKRNKSMVLENVWDFLSIALICGTIELLAQDLVQLFRKPLVLKSIHYVTIDKTYQPVHRVRRYSA